MYWAKTYLRDELVAPAITQAPQAPHAKVV